MIVRLAVVALATLAVGTDGAGADVDPCPAVNPPNVLVLAGGSGQTAQLGKQFETPFQVQLANTNGCPLSGDLAGHLVDFYSPGDGAGGSFPSTGSREAIVGTNAQGLATAPTFVANRSAGSFPVTAHSDYGNVDFYLTNTAAGVPSQLSAVGAATASAAANEQYRDALQVRVTDVNGNPVTAADVTFAVAPGATGAGAAFVSGQGVATTDADGVATSPLLVANATPGSFTVTASVAGVAGVVAFHLTNHAAALSLKAAPASPRANAVAATVRDGHGVPVEGATVTFEVESATGARATFVGGGNQASAITDAHGRAFSPRLVRAPVAGSFTVVASTPGARAVRYALVTRAGAPAAIAAGAASGQSTTVRTRFPVRLAVTVTDAHGNHIAGAVVLFTAPRLGASGRFAGHGRTVRVSTNTDGVAIAPPLRANGSAGGYAVTASVGGLRAAFALVNEPAR